MSDFNPDLEYLSDFNIFEKKDMIFRLSQIPNKVAESDSMMILPKNVMLHILDNVSHSDQATDTPDISKYPYLMGKGNIKHFTHFTDLNTIPKKELKSFSHRIYRPKLMDHLLKFNKANRQFFLPDKRIDKLVGNRNIVIVSNYNPLYRLVATGTNYMQQYIRFELILKTALSTIAKIERTNFLVVPVPDNLELSRTNLMSIINDGKASNSKLQSDSHFYFFVIHLVALLLDNESRLSVFTSMGNRNLGKLNIWFSRGDKSIIFNVGVLAQLIDTKQRTFDLVDSLINLSRVRVKPIQPKLEIPGNPKVKDNTNVIQVSEKTWRPRAELFVIKDNKLVCGLSVKGKSERYVIPGGGVNDGETSEEAAKRETLEEIGVAADNLRLYNPEPKNVPYSPPDDKLPKWLKDRVNIKISKYLGDAYSSYVADYDKEDKSLWGIEKDSCKSTTLSFEDAIKAFDKQRKSYESGSYDYLRLEYTLEILVHLNRMSKTGELSKPVKAKASSTSIPKSILPAMSEPNSAQSSDVKGFIQNSMYSTNINKTDSNVGTDYIDTSTAEFIDKYENATPKQKERAKLVSQKYKQIKITDANGKSKTFEDILNEDTDMSVKSTNFDIIADQVPDPSMAKSSTVAYNEDYVDKLLQKDIISSVVAFQSNGLFVTGYTETNEVNSFTSVKHVKVAFEDVSGKKHTVHFKLPIPDEDGYYLVNGVKLSMTKQLINVPICKISPVRVSLISNYNKTLVEKVTSTRNDLVSSLVKQSGKLNISMVPKTNTFVGIKLPYEYKQIGMKYSEIMGDEYDLFFDYPNRPNTDAISKLESKHGVVFGKSRKERSNYVFMKMNSSCTVVNVNTGNVIDKDRTVLSCISDKITAPYEWCNLKILDKQLPIIFLLAYKFGFTSTLSYIGAKYQFVPSRQKYESKATDIVIQFSDGKLIIDRYPLMKSYIVAGLKYFPTLRQYRFDQLDDIDLFYQLLTDKGMSINYLKGIDNHFSFFIDPITRDVLQEMKEPTNTRDLLIRAVDMLVNNEDKPPSSLSNFRLRSTEKLPSIIYNEISRQYANHINSNFKDTAFSINTEAIFQRLIQDQTMTLKEEINPVAAIKENGRVTYTGFGGRTAESFVERDRKYPKDAIGILGETTTDSGSVGMVTTLTGDPNIKNLRGMIDTDSNPSELPPTKLLSDTTLLMPNVTHDD